MTMALDAAASRMSDSEICPTALCLILTWISSVLSLISESERASMDPSTSPFTITFSSWKLPMAIRRPISSSVICLVVLSSCSRCSCSRLLAISLASLSVDITLKLSPACGAPFKPSIKAGVDGPAMLTFLPLSLNMAFT